MKKLIMTGLAALMIAGVSSVSKATPVGEMDVDISGLAQLNYNWSEQTGSNDGLDLQRLRLNISAAPAEKVKFYTSIESTDNISGLANGAGGARNAIMDGIADSRIVDLYADITYLDWVTVRVGQFALPNSYEMNTAEYDLETINYTMGAGMFGTRDRGFLFSGQPVPDILKMSVWAVNGVGAITGAGNNDDDLSNYGLQFDWKALESLSFKLWGAWQNDSAMGNTDQNAFGLGADYKYAGFHLCAEYNDADTEAGAADVETNQWAILLGYEIPETGVQLVARYDDLDQELGAVTLIDGSVTTLGFNWAFEKNAKLSVMRDFPEGSDNDSLDVQLSVKF